MEAYFLDRFLFVFGLIIFAFCLVFFVVNFLSDFDGMMFILTLFGMLNASIAMGVSKIISVIKVKNKCELF